VLLKERERIRKHQGEGIEAALNKRITFERLKAEVS